MCNEMTYRNSRYLDLKYFGVVNALYVQYKLEMVVDV